MAEGGVHATEIRRFSRQAGLPACISDGVLYRTAELSDGRSYRHTYTFESFADVARFIEEHRVEGVTTTDLWD